MKVNRDGSEWTGWERTELSERGEMRRGVNGRREWMEPSETRPMSTSNFLIFLSFFFLILSFFHCPRRFFLLVASSSSSLLPLHCSFPLVGPSSLTLLLPRHSFLLVPPSSSLLLYPRSFLYLVDPKHCLKIQFFTNSDESVTDGPTDGPTDRRTSQASYRDERMLNYILMILSTVHFI